MNNEDELYFKNATEWREWLEVNHASCSGIFLVFYKVESAEESMRWEEAVKVALCYGWIDSVVKKIDNQKRKQKYTPRKDKSVWSKVNKSHLEQLEKENLIHPSGYAKIEMAKKNGSWESLDAVEALEIPADLQTAFDANTLAFENYNSFSPSYRKNYLHWLNQAKREQTRQNRIVAIVDLCSKKIKSRF